jgi:hypothetical protein
MQALAKYVFQSGMRNASNILASFFKLRYRSSFTSVNNVMKPSCFLFRVRCY